MRFRAGGVLFSVEPDDELTEAERAALDRLDPPEEGAPQEPLRIDLVADPPWTSDDDALFPRMEPAVQRWVGSELLCSHRSFTAAIDPAGAQARVQRRETRAYPLEAVIRTAMMARLPLLGGLPLHSAGVVLDGRGLAFFGPSGAGKTTLAGTCPATVLSDELVAVEPHGDDVPWLVRSGFWGEGKGEGRPTGAPLAALVSLGRGPAYRLETLPPVEAARRIIGALPVPLAPPLWSRALAVVADLVSRIPVYRLEWSMDEPPWDSLARDLPAPRS